MEKNTNTNINTKITCQHMDSLIDQFEATLTLMDDISDLTWIICLVPVQCPCSAQAFGV